MCQILSVLWHQLELKVRFASVLFVQPPELHLIVPDGVIMPIMPFAVLFVVVPWADLFQRSSPLLWKFLNCLS